MWFRSLNSVAVIVLSVAVLGDGRAAAPQSELRDLAGFDAIQVSGSVELVVRQGSGFRVEVAAQSGELDNLVTEVERGTLQIGERGAQRRWFGSGTGGDYRVDVTLPELRALDASGGTDVRVEGVITGGRLTLAASGGADVHFIVEVNELEVRTSGGSDMILGGSTQHFDARSSGGSDLVATRLHAKTANIQSSGGSDVLLDVSEELIVRASGGSDVVYTGNPETVEVASSGGAEVTRQ